MTQSPSHPFPTAGFASPNTIAAVVLFAVAALLWWLSARHATVLPFWAPWEFSWLQFLTIWLVVWWYVRGLVVSAAEERPSLWRQAAFFSGMLVIYTVVQTRFEYLAEHMFFLNRLQHIGMHHLGPMLVALAWPGATIKQGMPRFLSRFSAHPAIAGCLAVVQQPVIAGVLFVGLIGFWLIPSVHFRAMIDPDLYALMNWSMVVDGLLFWCLVLDPRPSPPARASFGTRAALAALVMFPQIMGGALIAFTPRDLYSFYDLCGRIYPNLGAHDDQTVGGLIIWIPPAMMSVLALVLVLNALRRAEEQGRLLHEHHQQQAVGIQASDWTG